MPGEEMLLQLIPMAAKKMDSAVQKDKNAAMAIVNMMAARKAAKKAKKLEPPIVDNNMAQLNDELNAIRKGVSPAMKESIRQLNVAHANAAKDIMSASGGASGAAIAGLAGLDANVGDSLGKLYVADVPNQQMNMRNYIDSENAMIDRRYQIQANRFFNASAKAANLEQQAGQEWMTALNGGKESEVDSTKSDLLAAALKPGAPIKRTAEGDFSNPNTTELNIDKTYFSPEDWMTKDPYEYNPQKNFLPSSFPKLVFK